MCQNCLREQIAMEGEASYEPLSPTKEVLWRATMRTIKIIRRYLDIDLSRGAVLTAGTYTTIMHLSEAPSRELRMAEVASATELSASRMTRLVDDLQSRGLATKTASASDARGNDARLTPRGMAKLKSAWPAHLTSVRSRFSDSVEIEPLGAAVAKALVEVAVHLEDACAAPRGWN
jgi:DNA-binding MarR family transcriptional regulator